MTEEKEKCFYLTLKESVKEKIDAEAQGDNTVEIDDDNYYSLIDLISSGIFMQLLRKKNYNIATIINHVNMVVQGAIKDLEVNSQNYPEIMEYLKEKVESQKIVMPNNDTMN